MNKEKIIGLSDRLNVIVDEANRHPNGTPGPITWDKAEYAIGVLSEEANSKPVMPKIFDDWYKQAIKVKSEYSKDLVSIYAGLANVYLDSQWVDKGSKDMVNWLKHDDNRYLKCIDAIRYGYEVEK